jgi:hypothetical protein
MSSLVDPVAEAAEVFARRGFAVLEDIVPTVDIDDVRLYIVYDMVLHVPSFL